MMYNVVSLCFGGGTAAYIQKKLEDADIYEIKKHSRGKRCHS